MIHDPTTARTFAGSNLKVAKATMAELTALGVSTLAEACAVIKGQAKINIEIKSAGCEQMVVAAVQRFGYEQAVVSAFSRAALRQVHALDPKVRLAFLQSVNILGFLGLPLLFAVGFRHFLAPGFIVQLAKKRGFFTYAYTVDSPKRATVLANRGFDGLVTNRPDKF